jgi:Uma2 family endonuclease
MSTAPRYEPRYTIDDYRQWEGRWELWNGFPVSMTPSPFGRHAKALTDAAAAFKQAVDAAQARDIGCRATVLTEIDWIVATDTVVRPDLVVVCGGVPERHVETPPAIVVEVLSTATRHRDQTVKRELYLDQGVGWYVLIDPDAGSVEILESIETDGSLMWTKHASVAVAEMAICDHCRLIVSVDTLAARAVDRGGPAK